MKRGAGRQSSGEEQALPRSLREVVAGSVWLLVFGVALVMSLVLPFLVGVLLRLIVPWREIEQPVSVVLGLAFVLGAAGGLGRIATGKSLPGTTGQKVYAGIVLVVLG